MYNEFNIYLYRSFFCFSLHSSRRSQVKRQQPTRMNCPSPIWLTKMAVLVMALLIVCQYLVFALVFRRTQFFMLKFQAGIQMDRFLGLQGNRSIMAMRSLAATGLEPSSVDLCPIISPKLSKRYFFFSTILIR